jgi:hypothetical protein
VDVEFVTSSFCALSSCVEVGWTKSSASGGNHCVEVSGGEGGDGLVLVRDTKDRSKPAHEFTRAEWIAFIKGVKAGEFDLEEAR